MVEVLIKNIEEMELDHACWKKRKNINNCFICANRHRLHRPMPVFLYCYLAFFLRAQQVLYILNTAAHMMTMDTVIAA